MKKFLIPAALISLLVVPMAQAHPYPTPMHGSDGFHATHGHYIKHHSDDGPMMRGAHRGPGDQVRFDHVGKIRTFGMDEAEVKVFLDRVTDFLRIQPNQKAAWQAMQKHYMNLAKMHHQWRAGSPKEAKPMTPQQRLEWRAKHMERQAAFMKDFAKDRAALEKVFTPEQMRNFDELFATGRADLRPHRAPAPQAK